MKIGIYNEHLGTMGGGEKHMGSIIEYFLNKNNEVDLLTSKPVDLDLMSVKLKLNIKACRLIVLDSTSMELEKLSKNYDVFINSSYLSTLKPRAKKNLMILFFPNISICNLLSHSTLFRKLIKYINTFDNVEYGQGFYGQEKHNKYFKRKFGRWTNKDFEFSFVADKAQTQKIQINVLKLGQLSIQNDIEGVYQGNEEIAYKIKKNKIIFEVASNVGKNIIAVRLKDSFQKENDKRDLGIFVKSIYVKSGLLSWFKTMFLIVFKDFRIFDFLDYYDLVLANSEYTQKWLYKIWQKKATILYPLVEVVDFLNDEPKQKKIISVGRFFVGSHNKKHLIMIKAFKQMYDKGLLKGWEYNVCGGTHPEKAHQQYLEEIKNAAKGYPINICPDIPFTELKKMYSESSIFWHAAGYDENENRHPDKFEHFGITTVEAMASGCIPVVIGKAGQLEIVTDGISGFLWNDLVDLEEKMKQALRMPDESINKIRVNAINRAKDFSREAFFVRAESIFKDLEN